MTHKIITLQSGKTQEMLPKNTAFSTNYKLRDGWDHECRGIAQPLGPGGWPGGGPGRWPDRTRIRAQGRGGRRQLDGGLAGGPDRWNSRVGSGLVFRVAAWFST